MIAKVKNNILNAKVFNLIVYSEKFEAVWDNFILNSQNSTFLHTRKYLNYHKNKFQDASLIIYESDQIIGVFPAAIVRNIPFQVISHPGITYGGIIHKGGLTGEKMITAMEMIVTFYSGIGYKKLLYKAIPYIYMKRPSQDDIYGLFRLGASRVRCDLTSVIDLKSQRVLTDRRKRSLKKANKVIDVQQDINLLNKFWDVLTINLKNTHNSNPVHSIDEISELVRKFPENIELWCGLYQLEVVAGVIVFKTYNVWHVQYIASSELGNANSALDAVFQKIISSAKDNEVRYFDFGTSNENEGKILNNGLYKFKTEFGGGGAVHEYYEILF